MNGVKQIFLLAFFLEICSIPALSSPFDDLVDHLQSKIATSNASLFIIGIGGCPGVGKTTLATQLSERFASNSISSAILHIDDFNLPASERKNHGEWNLNHLYLDRLILTLQSIVAGEKVICKPTYDQTTGLCGEEILNLSKVRVLIFEGLYATCSHGKLNFLNQCSQTIFITAHPKNIYLWKKERNEKRHVPRTEEEFNAHMAAMFKEYKENIEYSKNNASIIVQKDQNHRIDRLEIKEYDASPIWMEVDQR